jgi:hypothetical protein
MQKVFISYRRDDSIESAGRIYDWLASRLPEDSVFIDVDSILAGADFREALEKTLDQTGVVLAVIGQKWLDIEDKSGRRRLDNPEDLVRIEIETAMQRKVPVMPILVQGAEMPTAQQLPESLAPFAYRNALQVRPNPDFNNDMGRVARALESYVPDLAVAAAPIPGRGPTVTRGAPLPVTQASPAPEKQTAPPLLPIGATVRAVRRIHYPWMVRRLLYANILEGIGVIALFLVNTVHIAGLVCSDYLDGNCEGQGSPTYATVVSNLIAVVFGAVAAILFLSMLVYTLTTLWKQRRWGWFGSVLGLAIIGIIPLYPYLGLWGFSLFGPTTPASLKPTGQSAKS